MKKILTLSILLALVLSFSFTAVTPVSAQGEADLVQTI